LARVKGDDTNGRDRETREINETRERSWEEVRVFRLFHVFRNLFITQDNRLFEKVI
jgi:hypothetical protein